jgi:hypothetical protein
MNREAMILNKIHRRENLGYSTFLNPESSHYHLAREATQEAV